MKKKIWISVFLTLFLPLALATYDYPSDLEGSNAPFWKAGIPACGLI